MMGSSGAKAVYQCDDVGLGGHDVEKLHEATVGRDVSSPELISKSSFSVGSPFQRMS